MYEKDRRKHKECGNDIEVCGDSEREWHFSPNVCYPSMLQAFADWCWDKLHGEQFHDGTLKNWSGTRDMQYRYGHRDGLTIIVSEHDFTPDDDFLRLAEYFSGEPETEPRIGEADPDPSERSD